MDQRTETPETPLTQQSLAKLGGITMPVSVELGRTRMVIGDITHLAKGSVIQLTRLAGEPVDIIVGDKRFAEGEVVVIGEHFGVRITRLVPAAGES